MKYMGGKFLSRKQICKYLKTVIVQNGITHYIEPFCGSLWICSELARITPNMDFHMDISDAHPSLMLMWQAIKDGWLPDVPQDLQELEQLYKKLKSTYKTTDSKEHGFFGFSCAFAGNYFKGFGKSNVRYKHYGNEAVSSIKIYKLPYLHRFTFNKCDYTKYDENIKGALIYCDPPYKNTHGYNAGVFRHDEFYAWCRKMSKHNIVLISEIEGNVPDDFKSVLELRVLKHTNLNHKQRNDRLPRKEHLFAFSGSRDFNQATCM